jgi:type VI secretion system protein ImpH
VAAKDRSPTRYLTFLREAAQNPRRFSLFALVRGAAARSGDKPPVGKSRLPSQDILRLHQIPHTSFPAPTLEKIDMDGEVPSAGGYWLGLTGPMAPLPLHLTEFAMYERKFAKHQPFGDFLDLLAGRFLQLFYRSWAVSQPAVQADRPEQDRFSERIDQLTGAGEGTDASSAMPRFARLFYASQFASRRSAGAIEGMLRHLLQLPVRVFEFQPRWSDVEAEDQTRLGVQHHRLGDAMIGSRMLLVSYAFTVEVTSSTEAEFRQLLPSGGLFPIVRSALDAISPGHLEWSVTLRLPGKEAPPAALDGRTPLGWCSWLGKVSDGEMRGDVHLRRTAVQ